MQAEEWRAVVGYEGYYEVSSFGRVRRIAKYRCTYENRIRVQRETRAGYLALRLYRDDIPKYCFVHRLVVEAFIGTIPDGMQVNHVDGDKKNNIVDNLEIVTGKENIAHAYRLGLRPTGVEHPLAKLSIEQVREIRQKYVPVKYSLPRLAKEYGLSVSTVYDIVRRDTWKNV